MAFPLPFKFGKKSQTQAGIDPSVVGQPPAVSKSSVPTHQARLSEIEKEIEAQYVQTRPLQQPKQKKKGGWGKLMAVAILLGIPVGVVYVANLPYSVIRRPVARTVPILLVPSYISIDNNFRSAIASLEQSKQLIENPTSFADLEQGEIKVKAAQKHLDALPISYYDDLPNYRYWWYDSYFNLYRFNTARTEIGQLSAKVFQERNAQTLFVKNDQALVTAKEQYQVAKTPTDKQLAITNWRSAIDNLEQVPGETFAGKTVQGQIDNYKRDFGEVVGLAAGNERVSTLILAAQQFSWQAAKAGQNPPHSVAQWGQIEALWEQAIAQLNQIHSDDLTGYAKAQELIAQYNVNLGQVKVRRQAEAASVEALEQAQQEMQYLLSRTPPTDPESFPDYRSDATGRLQSIVNQLDKVQNGTTVYLKAKELQLSAQNKLNQLQSK